MKNNFNYLNNSLVHYNRKSKCSLGRCKKLRKNIVQLILNDREIFDLSLVSSMFDETATYDSLG